MQLDVKLRADWVMVSQSVLKGLLLFSRLPGAPEVGTGLPETPLKPAVSRAGQREQLACSLTHRAAGSQDAGLIAAGGRGERWV